MNPRIEKAFPALRTHGYTETSPVDFRYNCIAWAVDASETSVWWWPVGDDPASYFPPKLVFWPKGVSNACTIESFIGAFGSRGWSTCADGVQRIGFEKIALYADSGGEPTHAARQLPDGAWTSKLGDWEDITHNTAEALEGIIYGKVTAYLERPIIAR